MQALYSLFKETIYFIDIESISARKIVKGFILFYTYDILTGSGPTANADNYDSPVRLHSAHI